MGAGRPTKKRQENICTALNDAYDTLKHKNPTYQVIVDKANEFEVIINSKEGPIGVTTLKQPKTKDIETLFDRINEDRENIRILKTLAPTEFSNKIDQLHSSLGANALLAIQIENLENRLENKEKIIADKDRRITEYQEELRQLRDELINIKAGK